MLKYCSWILAVITQFAVASLAYPTDFNGDGKQDLVWRNHAGNPVVWQMNGLAIDSRSTLPAAADAASAIVGSGNFFGSSPGGILWVNSSNELSIWRVSNGVVTQSCVVASGIDPTWSYLATGDMNGDGIDDVWWRLADGSVKVFLINGCNAPQTLTLDATADPSWSFAGIGDVDGAGRAALFWREPNGHLTLWRPHTTTSIFSTSLNTRTLATWAIAAVADFDGDGRADVLWRDAAGTQMALLLMNGTKFVATTVTAATSNVFVAADDIFIGGFDSNIRPAPLPTASWTVLGATDVNGDGRADIVLADDQGETAICQMQGASITATGLIPASGDMPYAGLTGWRMVLDRPVVTKVSNQVTITWHNISGPQNYIVYASSANAPASTGVPIAVTDASLSFGRDDNGYVDKRYFAVGASYLGVQLPPSPEAYIVEFTQTALPYWGAMAIADINRDGCTDILGALGDCHGGFMLLNEADMGLSALRAPGRVYRDLRFADLDGDGIDDLIANTYSSLSDSNSQVLFFHGIGNSQFVEDVDFTNLQIRGFGETIVIADFNNDGHLDVFLPHYSFNSPDEHSWLLINDGIGHFIDVADAAGVAMRNVPACARVEGAQALDINGDGRIDIYGSSNLFLNNGVTPEGIPTFQDLGPVITDGACNYTLTSVGLPVIFDEGAKFIDLDNSGQLSLVLNTVDTYSLSDRGVLILKFDGIGHFSQPFTIPNLWVSESLGLNAADIDGDGLTDLVVAGGCDASFFNGGYTGPCWNPGNPHALPQLLVNRDANFVPYDFYDDGLLTTQRGWNNLQTFADFDANGTVDWVSNFADLSDEEHATGGQLSVLMNRAASHDSILVSLVGNNGEHNQAGRVVRVSPKMRPDVIMTQVVDGGSGYMSNGPYDLMFATPYPGAYTLTARFAGGAYTLTAHAGDHVTLRANGTYSVQ